MKDDKPKREPIDGQLYCRGCDTVKSEVCFSYDPIRDRRRDLCRMCEKVIPGRRPARDR